MKLTKRDIRDTVVVDLERKLVGGAENSAKFHEFIKTLLDDGKNKVVISLRNTLWADSWGIGMVLSALTSVNNAGGELVLAHVNDRIKDILAVTRLHLIFRTFESEDEAVDYLRKRTEDSTDVSSE